MNVYVSVLMAQNQLNKLIDLSNKIHQSYITSGAFMSMKTSGWPVPDEVKTILDKIDDILYAKYGIEKTVWDKQHGQPKNAKGEWRWIIDAYYRDVNSSSFAMIGLEFEVEPAIYLISYTKNVISFPLSDPGCFDKVQHHV